MDSKRETSVIRKIFAITSTCMLSGHLPNEKDKLMKLFEKVEATKEEIIQLAKDNKLQWVREYDPYCFEKDIEEYNKRMSLSLAHYLSN